MKKTKSRSFLLGWILSSAAVKKFAPRLTESVRERRVLQDFRTGRIGAAASAAGCDVDLFLRQIGAAGKIAPSLRSRISRALQEYARLWGEWQEHMRLCERVFWEAPPAPHEKREALHHARRRLSNACHRPAGLFDFLLRRPRLFQAVTFHVPRPGEVSAKFREELARPELLFAAPASAPEVSISHGLSAAPRTREYLIRFRSPSRFMGDLAYARVVEPEDPRPDAPVVLYCGPFGMAYDQLMNWPEEKYLSRPLAQRGCRILLLEAPWHGRRTPAGYSSGEYFISSSPAGCIEFLSAQVQEIAAAAAWVRSRWGCPLLLAGMSLGGMAVQQAVAWCHTWPGELRPDAVLICASGMYPERIIARSSLARSLGITRELRSAGWKAEDFAMMGRLFEPGAGTCMDPARMIAVLGSHDTIVPYAYGMDMAARWRIPPENTVVWKTGHIGVLTDMLRTPQGAELFARAVGLAKDQFTLRAGRRDSA